MLYSDVDIRELLTSGKLKISPLSEDQIGGASVDLTLSDEWHTIKKQYLKKTVDLSKTDFTEVMEKKHAPLITLKPGALCLARTVEKLTLSSSIIGSLEGRSRYARMGVCIHITSALVQPGSDNHQVLEIANFAPFSITLHAGMRISQVVFEELRTPTSKPYAKFGSIAKEQ